MTDDRHASDPRHARVVAILRTYRGMSASVAARLANAILDAVNGQPAQLRDALEKVLHGYDVYLQTHEIDELAAAVAEAREALS